jgi:hypothetical protein
VTTEKLVPNTGAAALLPSTVGDAAADVSDGELGVGVVVMVLLEGTLEEVGSNVAPVEVTTETVEDSVVVAFAP